MDNNFKFFLYKLGKSVLSTVVSMSVSVVLQILTHGEINKDFFNIIFIFSFLWLLVFYKYHSLKELTIYKNEVIILSSNLCRNIERLKIKFNNEFYDIVVFYSPTKSIEEFHFNSQNKPNWKSQLIIIKALERRSKS